MKWWNDYWFRPAPYVDLAMVRIVLVGCQLLILLRGKFSYETIQMLSALPDELYQPITLLRLFLLPWGLDYRPSPDFVSVVYYINVLAGILALVGLRTRTSLFVFTLTGAFLVSYEYSHSDFHHTEAPMIIGLALLAISPSGRVLSVDHWLRKRRTRDGLVAEILTAQGPLAGWPRRLIQWLFVLIYVSAVLSKLLFEGGLDWLNGFTLQYYMIQDSLRKGTLLGEWFSQFHDFILLSQYMVVTFQATFWLAVLFPRVRWIYVPLGIGFHVANWVLLNAPFPEWIALYAVFIPWQRIFIMVSRREIERQRDPQLAT